MFGFMVNRIRLHRKMWTLEKDMRADTSEKVVMFFGVSIQSYERGLSHSYDVLSSHMFSTVKTYTYSSLILLRELWAIMTAQIPVLWRPGNVSLFLCWPMVREFENLL